MERKTTQEEKKRNGFREGFHWGIIIGGFVVLLSFFIVSQTVMSYGCGVAEADALGILVGLGSWSILVSVLNIKSAKTRLYAARQSFKKLGLKTIKEIQEKWT